ncbi:hypothetical protein BDV98DRAFT_419836 [Pterulicium gracile]|uniref:Homeobox domain-containing protein n=1 Tax=Pterulicium gracile TaxID=1884261 RepID=A0A5C3QSG2_9AGAR|nr:hypothetical protein BDV98DRAFT_419836 [Pterula gracilis]
MSSSANSVADTESSVASRGEKRPLSPSHSPPPKRRSTEHNNNGHTSGHSPWELDSSSTGPDHDDLKVHLPSISTSFHGQDPTRRASLPTLSDAARLRHSGTTSYTSSPLAASSDLASYTFPPVQVDSRGERSRPNVHTDIPNYHYSDSPYTNPGLTASSGTPMSGTNFSFGSPLNSDHHYSSHRSTYPDGESWNASHIPRPNSTPGHLSATPASSSVKYQDAMRHASFSNSSPLSASTSSSHMPMYPTSARISGHPDRRGSHYDIPPIKSDHWSFSDEYSNMSAGAHPSSHYPTATLPTLPPSSGLSVGSNVSPRSSSGTSAPPPPPPRKRGKLPKETTDFLKSWLHRHSDHPYPSEDEKKQLCHATGLSMSQVSNWMINARRRILAPVHRAASANAAANNGSSNSSSNSYRSAPASNSLSNSHLLETRRASMPADNLQLYHPLTLQSVPNTPTTHHGVHHHSSSPHHQHHGSDYLSARPIGASSAMRSASMSHAPPGSGSHLDSYGRSNSLSMLAINSGSNAPSSHSYVSQGGYGGIYGSSASTTSNGYGLPGSTNGSSPYGP